MEKEKASPPDILGVTYFQVIQQGVVKRVKVISCRISFALAGLNSDLSSF